MSIPPQYFVLKLNIKCQTMMSARWRKQFIYPNYWCFLSDGCHSNALVNKHQVFLILLVCNHFVINVDINTAEQVCHSTVVFMQFVTYYINVVFTFGRKLRNCSRWYFVLDIPSRLHYYYVHIFFNIYNIFFFFKFRSFVKSLKKSTSL